MQAPQPGLASQLDSDGEVGLWLRVGKQTTETLDGLKQLDSSSLQDCSSGLIPVSEHSGYTETTLGLLRDGGKDIATTVQQTLSSDKFTAWKKSWASNSSQNMLLQLTTQTGIYPPFNLVLPSITIPSAIAPFAIEVTSLPSIQSSIQQWHPWNRTKHACQGKQHTCEIVQAELEHKTINCLQTIETFPSPGEHQDQQQ
ncbi:hypothetical protein APHAL10511_003437 [Amanita phalloides]|nr:hypothetical protein APHAL10511_003437 [Amanita phalloides]